MIKVLLYSSLYPNNIWPNRGIFTKERMTPLLSGDACQFQVVAPVPYFPPIKLGYRWRFSQIARQEMTGDVAVFHPRYFMTPKVGRALYGLAMFLSVLPKVKEIRTAFDFDIIDAHFAYPDGFAAVLLGQYFKKPVVVTSHGTDINLLPQFPLIRQLLRYTLLKADRVIAVCQALKDAMIQLQIPGEKIAVIPNGVDISKFHPIPREEARSRLNIPHRRVILSVGSLIPVKGYDLLLKALKTVVQEFGETNVYLVIAGEGPSRGKIENLASSLGLSEYVRLLGAVPHNELNVWYNVADLFCLASSREGWPCVLLESLACGTPVVATDTWGVPELISSETIGLLTQRDERDMAEKIHLALKTPWHRDEIVRYACEHTWDRAAQAVFEVFNSALQGFSSRGIRRPTSTHTSQQPYP
jgi:teichuronic acid biosynthesis glycosyltransferase TuaC